MTDACRIVRLPRGQVIRIHGEEAPSPAAAAAIEDVIDAAKAMLDAEPLWMQEERERKQAAGRARIRAIRDRLGMR